jgi:lactoylglutathione lyase
MKLHHLGMEVNDLERSILFYKTLLGLHFIKRVRFLKEELIFLQGEGLTIEFIQKETPLPSSSHLAFHTESIYKTMLGLEDKGIYAMEGPYTLNNGWRTVFYEGPDGETIEFIEE